MTKTFTCILELILTHGLFDWRDVFVCSCICKDIRDMIKQNDLILSGMMMVELLRRNLHKSISIEETYKKIISTARGFRKQKEVYASKILDDITIISSHIHPSQEFCLIIRFAVSSSNSRKSRRYACYAAELFNPEDMIRKQITGGDVLGTCYGIKWISSSVLVCVSSPTKAGSVMTFHYYSIDVYAEDITLNVVSSICLVSPFDITEPKNIYCVSSVTFNSGEAIPTQFVSCSSRGCIYHIDTCTRNITPCANYHHAHVCSYSNSSYVKVYYMNSSSWMSIVDSRISLNESQSTYNIPHQFVQRVRTDETKYSSVFISCGRSNCVEEYDTRFRVSARECSSTYLRKFGESTALCRISDFTVCGERLLTLQTSGAKNIKTSISAFLRGSIIDPFSNIYITPTHNPKSLWNVKFGSDVSSIMFESGTFERFERELEDTIHFTGKDALLLASPNSMFKIRVEY